jgi:DNA helicase-2/ATP-dependent DNA helicase PcrA
MRERTVTSPFLSEMPEDALRITDRTTLDTLGDRDEEREFVREESDDLAVQFRRGQMVRHPTFGIGRIADVSNLGQHTRAVIEFNSAGRKTLILQYAKLEPVG